MSTLCICGCTKAAHAGSQYHGTDDSERGHHRSKRQTRLKAEERAQAKARVESERLFQASIYASMSMAEMAVALDGALRLMGAVVGQMMHRMSQADEGSVLARIDTARDPLLTMARQREQANLNRRRAQHARDLPRAGEQARANQSDADVALADRSARRGASKEGSSAPTS